MHNAAALLKQGGKLFLYDLHPFLHLLDYADPARLQSGADYFRKDPEECHGLDYIGGREYEASPNYQFSVRLGDLLGGIAGSGMKLETFVEFEHCMYPHFPQMVQRDDGLYYMPDHPKQARFPMMMLVTAVKI